MSMAHGHQVAANSDAILLAERFCKELDALGGEAFIADSIEQAAQIVVTCLAKWQTEAVATSGDVARDFPTVAQAVSAKGVAMPTWVTDIKKPRDMANIQAGLVVADLAIAATGTLALMAAPGKGRSISLLPPAMLALVPVSRLVASRSKVFVSLRKQASQSGGQAAGYPSAVSFVTGPSRTADIESDLSIGVHGPGQVVAIVVMGS